MSLDGKGAIEALGFSDLQFRRGANPEFALYVDVVSGEQVVGMIGQLMAANTPLSGAVIIAQIELESLAETSRAVCYADVDRFPAITRDIAMIVPETLPHAEVERVIRSADEPLLAHVRLFDLFSGKAAESLGPARKSMAYTLTYRDKNRTLTHDEVTVVHNRIRERLQREVGAELRE